MSKDTVADYARRCMASIEASGALGPDPRDQRITELEGEVARLLTAPCRYGAALVEISELLMRVAEAPLITLHRVGGICWRALNPPADEPPIPPAKHYDLQKAKLLPPVQSPDIVIDENEADW